MISVNKIISLIFLIINIFGTIISLLIGKYNGSGGETTELVYLGLFYTNMISFLFVFVIFFIKFSWWRLNFIWIILILLLYSPITFNVLTLKINKFKANNLESFNFGIPTSKNYQNDKLEVELYLFQKGDISYKVDTLLYSKDLSQILIVGYFIDNNGNYKNFELFAKKIDNRLNINKPSGGNLIASDTNKQILIRKVIEWYINNYSLDNNKNSLWNYTDFWFDTQKK